MDLKKCTAAGAAALSVLFSLTALSVPAQAEETLKEGQIIQSIRADLNKDGKDEVISLKIFKLENEENGFCKLIVTDTAGKALWAGPADDKISSPSVLGCWCAGVSELQTAADIDGDGRLELIITKPISDVRPHVFDIWRWDGRGFKYMRTKSLINKDLSNNKFYWTDPVADYGEIRWICRLKPAKSSSDSRTLNADIIKFTHKDVGSGSAEMTIPSAKYLEVKSWTDPVHP